MPPKIISNNASLRTPMMPTPMPSNPSVTAIGGNNQTGWSDPLYDRLIRGYRIEYGTGTTNRDRVDEHHDRRDERRDRDNVHRRRVSLARAYVQGAALLREYRNPEQHQREGADDDVRRNEKAV